MRERQFVTFIAKQALHAKFGDKEKDKPKLFLETICLRIGNVGCSNIWCQSKVVVFIVENAIKGEEVGHS